MKKKYLLVEPDGDITRGIFHDLEGLEEVDVLLKPDEIGSTFLRYAKRIHLSRLINQVVNLPFKRIWDKYYTLTDYPFDDDTEYYIIFGNCAIAHFDLKYLNRLRRGRTNLKYVLYFTDPIASEYSAYGFKATKKFKFDYVYTFDPDDALRNDFLYTGPMYSYKPVEETPISSDLYFIGVDKDDRLPILRKTYDLLAPKGIKCDFFIANVRKRKIRNDGLHYNERCSYEDVVNNLQKYRAILDIVQNEQSGVSLRYEESICYNKKLISNNPAIRRLPYYSPENMLIFEDPSEIDPNWILEGPCDYGYQGEFTPINWIHRLGCETLEENRAWMY